MKLKAEARDAFNVEVENLVPNSGSVEVIAFTCDPSRFRGHSHSSGHMGGPAQTGSQNKSRSHEPGRGIDGDVSGGGRDGRVIGVYYIHT